MMRPAVRALRLLAPLRGALALSVLLGAATVGCGIGLMATSAYLISAAALHPSVAALGVAIVGVRFFGIARGLFRYLERYVSHAVTFSVLARLRVWFYAAVEPLAPARLQGRHSGDLLSRVVSDIETLQDFYGRVVAPPIVAALVGGAVWLFLGAYDGGVALAWLACYLAAAVLVPALAGALSRRLGRDLLWARAALTAHLVDSIQGLPELLAFGQAAPYAGRLAVLDARLVRLQTRLAWVTGLQTALGNAIMHLAMWTMLIVAIPLVRAGRLDGVYLAVLVLAALSSFEAVLPLPGAAQHLGSSLEAARRIFALADSPPAVTDPTAPAPPPDRYDLDVAHLTFRYAPGEPLALDDVSFTLPAGGCVAIVGPSGAGKSTIGNLLLRFWDDESGAIRLGGRPLGTYAAEDVRARIAVVSQPVHLFNTTIGENLRLARPDATAAELDQAIARAQLTDFVANLPRGLDTPVGEQGLRVSDGERQRIGIARAFLQDAPLLLLDEPTANLDALTEQGILEAIRALRAGRTTLLITHRLVGLDLADTILVLRDGRIVESGRHSDLLQLEGAYWRMWEVARQGLPAGVAGPH